MPLSSSTPYFVKEELLLQEEEASPLCPLETVFEYEHQLQEALGCPCSTRGAHRD